MVGYCKLNIDGRCVFALPGHICLMYARQGDSVLVLHAVTLSFLLTTHKGKEDREPSLVFHEIFKVVN